MYFAARSFTDPPGFWPSSFTTMRTRGFGLSADTSTIGVLPMRSSMESYTGIGRIPIGSVGNGTGGASLHHHGLFGDRAVDDAVRAQHRLGLAQRHDHVVPGRVGRLRDVGQ